MTTKFLVPVNGAGRTIQVDLDADPDAVLDAIDAVSNGGNPNAALALLDVYEDATWAAWVILILDVSSSMTMGHLEQAKRKLLDWARHNQVPTKVRLLTFAEIPHEDVRLEGEDWMSLADAVNVIRGIQSRGGCDGNHEDSLLAVATAFGNPLKAREDAEGYAPVLPGIEAKEGLLIVLTDEPDQHSSESVGSLVPEGWRIIVVTPKTLFSFFRSVFGERVEFVELDGTGSIDIRLGTAITANLDDLAATVQANLDQLQAVLALPPA